MMFFFDGILASVGKQCRIRDSEHILVHLHIHSYIGDIH